MEVTPAGWRFCSTFLSQRSLGGLPTVPTRVHSLRKSPLAQAQMDESRCAPEFHQWVELASKL